MRDFKSLASTSFATRADGHGAAKDMANKLRAPRRGRRAGGREFIDLPDHGGMILPGCIRAPIEGFERELRALRGQFHGIDLMEQAMQRYAAIMGSIPREFLDQAHDALYASMRSHGLARRDGRAPPVMEATRRLGEHPAGA